MEYDDTLERLVRAAIEKVVPGVLGKMEDEFEELRKDAARDWPVKTGRSRAGLEVVTTVDIERGRVEVGLRNDVDYAIYVRLLSAYSATTAWERLARKPGRLLRKKLIDELGPVIVAALRRG